MKPAKTNKNIIYDNKVNEMEVGGYTERELNLLMNCFWHFRKNGTSKIKISFRELINLLNVRRPNEVFTIAEKFSDKLKLINQKITLDNGVVKVFNVFKTFTIDPNINELEISANEDFIEFFNKHLDMYTKFYLDDFISVSGKYAKIIFRKLKQFSKYGWWEVNMAEFRKTCNIPKSYRMTDIDRQVLNPSIKELSEYFIDLRVEKIKNGRKIDRLRFIFQRENEKSKKKNIPIDFSSDTQILDVFYKNNKKILELAKTTEGKINLYEIYLDIIRLYILKPKKQTVKLHDKEYDRNYVLKAISEIEELESVGIISILNHSFEFVEDTYSYILALIVDIYQKKG